MVTRTIVADRKPSRSLRRRTAFAAIVAVGFATAAVWRAETTSREAQGASDAMPSATAVRAGAPIPSTSDPTATRADPRSAVSSSPSEAPAQGEPVEEAQWMRRLRAAAASDEPLVIELARAGIERFPDSSFAPERQSILIHALARQGRSSEARGVAEEMVNRSPDSDWVREIERFTGAHRHRNVRVNDGGGLEYY